MPESYDAVVIGSGLGGLTAGVLLSHVGARVLVLERNASLGGAATTYHRGALTIEASLHETTTPSMPGDPKSELFKLIGLESAVELVPIPHLHEVRWKSLGEPFVLPHGFDAIEAALKDRFPEDQKAIRALIHQVRRTQRMPEFMDPRHGTWWKLGHAAELPLDLWAALRDIKSSLSEVFDRYFGDNEALKFALCPNLAYYSDDPDDLWWMAFAMAQGGYMKSGGYYIRGGSQRLTDRLIEEIRATGGAVLSESPAVAIDVGQEGAARGVRYRRSIGGEEITVRTANIFANAAPHVIRDMLPEPYGREFAQTFADRPLSISLLSATLGLDRPPADLGVASYSTLLIPDWMERFSDFKSGTSLLGAAPAGQVPALCVVDYSQIDSGLDDGGLHPLNVVCADRYENWADLDKAAYHARRDAWLAAIIARLDAEWPGLKSAVRQEAISTARTMHEHLNTPGGAVYGFAMIPPETLAKGPPRNVETTIEGLWLASAYTGFGGFTGAIGGGIAAAREALRKNLGGRLAP